MIPGVIHLKFNTINFLRDYVKSLGYVVTLEKISVVSVHINVDGTVFPCLAVSMGNIQDNNITDIIMGDEFKKFKKVLKENGTVEACNRCGWLQPK